MLLEVIVACAATLAGLLITLHYQKAMHAANLEAERAKALDSADRAKLDSCLTQLQANRKLTLEEISEVNRHLNELVADFSTRLDNLPQVNLAEFLTRLDSLENTVSKLDLATSLRKRNV
jgi:DNA anti-recombination protein RmuC